MENHDSGADQHRSIQRKAQQGWTESDNRQGKGRGAQLSGNRSRPGTTGRGTQTGSGRIWQTGELCQKKHGKRTYADSQESRNGQHPHTKGRQGALLPLCLKGHGITGGSVNGKGEGNRRREKPGETPSHRRNGTGEDRPEGVQGTTWLL